VKSEIEAARDAAAPTTPAEKLPKISEKVARDASLAPTAIMPRQRSKKLSASRKSVQDSAPEPDHEEEPEISDNESLDILDKDAEEEELERLVFGDGSTFKAQLGQEMDVDYEEGSDYSRKSQDEDAEGDGGLGEVDDAEVRTTPLFQTLRD
jgi:hypothetical protein